MSHADVFEQLRLALSDRAASHPPSFGALILSDLFDLDISYDAVSCTVTMRMENWMGNARGTMHGGVIAYGLDVSMGHLLNHMMGPAATIETSIRYLRPVLGGRVRFVAEILKKGKRLQTLQSRMFLETEECAALATSTWMLAHTQ